MNADRPEVLAKVYALISAKDDNKQKKFYRKKYDFIIVFIVFLFKKTKLALIKLLS